MMTCSHHSPLCLLGELGPLYQFILLCHDDGFWKWSVDEVSQTGASDQGLVTCNSVITGDWDWAGRHWRRTGHSGQAWHRRKVGLNIRKTGTVCKVVTRPWGGWGVREFDGRLTLCCPGVLRALLEVWGLTGNVCHSFSLHWLRMPWPPLVPGPGPRSRVSTAEVKTGGAREETG